MDKSRIIYVSKATKPFSKRDLLDLLHDSRAYNSIDKIYGFLFYKDGIFLQILEGKAKAINNLFSRIKKDNRHFDIQTLYQGSVDDYLFSAWSMGCTAFDDPELGFIPGISIELDSKKNINLLISNLPQISDFFLKHPQLNLK